MNVHIRTGGLLALLACLTASLIGCSAQAQPVAHTPPRPPAQEEVAAPASPPRAVGWLTVTTSQAQGYLGAPGSASDATPCA